LKNALIESRRYPVYCAWCAKEGNTTLVNMSSVRNSSGICKKHADELKNQADELAVQLGLFQKSNTLCLKEAK
jgi:hypothetical protein